MAGERPALDRPPRLRPCLTCPVSPDRGEYYPERSAGWRANVMTRPDTVVNMVPSSPSCAVTCAGSWLAVV
jgi:hypothetical protein